MTKLSVHFGFYPNALDIQAGDMTIQSLPDGGSSAAELLEGPDIEKDWIYAPPQETRDIMTGAVRAKPYSARVFGLPKTHSITHDNADNEDHLIFHLWSLSFFTGLRLTATEAGFLDATPLKPGALNDFVLTGDSLEQSVELAERFWIDSRSVPRQTRRFAAAVHALFLAQYPPALQFERFLYLYTALDACYAISAEMQPPARRPTHAQRAAWLCQRFGMDVPTWADPAVSGGTQVADIRNNAVHEALYMGEPLGFALHGVGTSQNLTLEFEALVCRFLVALIGGTTAEYVRTPVNTRQRQGLRLD